MSLIVSRVDCNITGCVETAVLHTAKHVLIAGELEFYGCELCSCMSSAVVVSLSFRLTPFWAANVSFQRPCTDMPTFFLYQLKTVI